ncbi:MAG: hypothetical protein N2Z79_03940 [Candidatus Omnitrophica bacterium]|nr:hypothetical protein [Candidatus Omnitrophota bacterium]
MYKKEGLICRLLKKLRRRKHRYRGNLNTRAYKDYLDYRRRFIDNLWIHNFLAMKGGF